MQSVTYISTHIPDRLLCKVSCNSTICISVTFCSHSLSNPGAVLKIYYSNLTSRIVFHRCPQHHLPTNAFLFRSAGHVLSFWGLSVNSWCDIVLISDESCPNTDSVTSHCDISSSYKGVEQIFPQSKTSDTASPWCQSFRWKEKVYVLQSILQQPLISFTERNPSPQRQ